MTGPSRRVETTALLVSRSDQMASPTLSVPVVVAEIEQLTVPAEAEVIEQVKLHSGEVESTVART